MSNVIAIIWDFDKTLIDGYMQEPLFKEYGVENSKFWREVNSLPAKYKKEQDVNVNPETIYLNHILKYVRENKFQGLNNLKLKDLGKNLIFYDGIEELFEDSAKILENPRYEKYSLKLEHYIVSTGLTEIIKGSKISDKVKKIWGCEFIEAKDENGNSLISEIAYTIDHTTKTRALFEINKGVNVYENIKVNTKLSKNKRRVPFENMIYIADGPSDIPAFSVVNNNGGHTFAIYPKGDLQAFKQVENMRLDQRVEMYAEADYSRETTAYIWIMEKVKEIAERIYKEKEEEIESAVRPTPQHLS